MRKGSNHLEFHPWTTKVWASPGMCPRANQRSVGGASHHNPFLPRMTLPGEALAASFLLDPVSPQAPDTTMLSTLWGRVGRAGKDNMGGAGVGSSRSWTRHGRDNETSILGVPVVRGLATRQHRPEDTPPDVSSLSQWEVSALMSNCQGSLWGARYPNHTLNLHFRLLSWEIGSWKTLKCGAWTLQAM